MGMNGKTTGRASSMPAGLAVGAIFAIIWTVTGAMIVALLVSGETLPETAIGYGALIILLTASFGAAQISFHKIKHRRALVCLLSGVIYLSMLIGMNALFFGGQYTGVGVTALAILGGVGTAILTGLRQGRGGRSRRFKIPKA